MYSYMIITKILIVPFVDIIYFPFSFLFKMGVEKRTLKLNHQTLILKMLVLMSGKNDILVLIYM